MENETEATTHLRWDHRDSRIYWFAEFERALRAGEIDLAAEARQQLLRLGCDVRFTFGRAGTSHE